MNSLKAVTATAVGGVFLLVASLSIDPAVAGYSLGGFDLSPEAVKILWGLAGVLITMYMPEGFFKSLALGYVKGKSGNVDVDSIKQIVEEVEDVLPLLVQLYRRLKSEGASESELKPIEDLVKKKTEEKLKSQLG
jgi:hypothetical protein